jgi:hypothetical protein
VPCGHGVPGLSFIVGIGPTLSTMSSNRPYIVDGALLQIDHRDFGAQPAGYGGGDQHHSERDHHSPERINFDTNSTGIDQGGGPAPHVCGTGRPGMVICLDGGTVHGKN